MWLFLLFRLIPFISLVASIGLLALFFLVPVRLIMWQVRFGGIQTLDIDYKRAKRNILVALGLWLLIIIIPVILIFLLAGTFAIFGSRA
jgi:ABC-type sulfate transport system permease subunit